MGKHEPIERVDNRVGQAMLAPIPPSEALIRLRHLARGLILTGRRPVSSVIAGAHLSRFRGRGVDFLESRHYQVGDDIRNLDWRVTARTGKPHTKVFQEERERPVIVMVDLDPAMYFATHGRLKSALAAEMAVLAGWAAVRRADRIGGLVFAGENHLEVRPRGGRRGVMALIRALETLVESPAQTDSIAPARGVALALERLRRVVRPGSLVLLFSDFAGLDEGCERHISRLRQHCDLAAFQIADPIEKTVPPPGQYPVAWGEERAVLDLSDQRRRTIWADTIIAPRVAARDRLHRYAVPVVDAATDADPLGILSRLFSSQGRGRAA